MKKLQYPILLLILCLMACGCSQQQVEQLRERVSQAQQASVVAQATVAEVQTARDAIALEVTALPEGDEKALWEDRLATADELLAKVVLYANIAHQTVTALDAALADATNEVGVAEGVGGAIRVVAPLVQPPWGTIGAAAVALVIALLSRRRKLAGLAVAKGIENAKANGKVDFNDPDVRVALRADMGPDGNALVDEAQGKKKSLPF